MSYVVALTFIHTAISLIALFLGIPTILNLFDGRRTSTWTNWFIITAVATTVTGFMFPFSVVTPAFATGIVAAIILAALLLARFVFHYRGGWRCVYAAAMVLSVYLLAFVGVVQAFLKIPFVNAYAPTQTEPAFLAAQAGVLLFFGIVTVLAVIRFKAVVEDVLV
jgi:hypothetical protein